MSLNSVCATFQTIFNRDDCSAAQAQVYALQAISRVQREVRLPCQERQLVITTTGVVDWISVPPDLIEIIDVIVADENGNPRALKHLPYRKLIMVDPNTWVSAYARLQSQIWLRGRVGLSSAIQLIYYGEFSPFADATVDNEITESAPDLIVYGALSYAADAFDHPSAQKWEQRYQSILADVHMMAVDLEMNGGPMQIQPLYGED